MSEKVVKLRKTEVFKNVDPKQGLKALEARVENLETFARIAGGIMFNRAKEDYMIGGNIGKMFEINKAAGSGL